MFLTIFQAVMYTIMSFHLSRDHDLLSVLLLFVGLAASLVLVFTVDTPWARISVPMCAAFQILCGLVLTAMVPTSLYSPYLPLAAEHLLIGVSSLFLLPQKNAEQEKQPRIS